MAGKILPPNTPIIDARGLVSPEWYRYFVAVQATLDSAPSTTDDTTVLLGGGGDVGDGGGASEDVTLLSLAHVFEVQDDLLPPAPSWDQPEDYLPPAPTFGLTQEEADRLYAPVTTTPVLGMASYLNIRTITATGAPSSDDYTLLCDATAGPITVNLAAAAGQAKRILSIKKTDASANAVTIDPNGAELVDGAAALAISTQWQAMTIHCNGTAWFVI